MKKKKGFTLIELLAVIIILAIIALIATPIIMRVIENSKKGAAERSAENYVRAVETQVLALKANGTTLEDGIYKIKQNGNICPDQSTDCSEENEIKIEMNGTKPDKGNIKIIESKVDSYAFMIGDYDFSKDMLPLAYQQVEYIESTGTQYIDTGVFLSNNNDVYLKLEIPESGSIEYNVFGARTSSTEKNFSITRSFQNLSVHFGSYNTNTSRITFDYDTIYNISVIGNTSIQINENNYSITPMTFATDFTAYLFALNGNSWLTTKASCRLYYCNINENKVSVRNFVPCYSTTTVTDVNGNVCPKGTIGLYDMIEGKFYTNQGNGTFLAGPSI